MSAYLFTPPPSSCCSLLLIPRSCCSIFETDRVNASRGSPVISLPPIQVPIGFTVEKFVNWIFNVSDPRPLYCLVDATFDDPVVAALKIESDTFLTDINTLTTIIPAFLRCYTIGARI